jgi:hypothetical protein
MHLQQFGTVTYDDKPPAESMLCMDVDLPDEAMLHVWHQDMKAEPPGAVFASLHRLPGGAIEMRPKGILRTNEIGGLFAPPLSADEAAKASAYRALLQPSGTGLEGEWSDGCGRKGRISLSPERANKNTMTDAYVCESWNDFKQWASNSRSEHDCVQFRGHGSNRFTLKTTFHRAGMHRLEVTAHPQPATVS